MKKEKPYDKSCKICHGIPWWKRPQCEVGECLYVKPCPYHDKKPKK